MVKPGMPYLDIVRETKNRVSSQFAETGGKSGRRGGGQFWTDCQPSQGHSVQFRWSHDYCNKMSRNHVFDTLAEIVLSLLKHSQLPLRRTRLRPAPTVCLREVSALEGDEAND